MDGWLKSDSMALGGPSRCAMRSRRKANDLAAEKLAQPYVSEEDVLAVLEQWYFSKNTTRTNVFPSGTTSVESDTLGLVRSRTGKVVATSITKKWPAVFQLFCRWLHQHRPPIFERPFACTSISVNYAYGARKHRDSFNVGPSFTKAFGAFEGGRLLYWPNDDGACALNELPETSAVAFESSRESGRILSPCSHSRGCPRGDRAAHPRRWFCLMAGARMQSRPSRTCPQTRFCSGGARASEFYVCL